MAQSGQIDKFDTLTKSVGKRDKNNGSNDDLSPLL